MNNETFVKNEWQNMRIGLKLQNIDNGIFLVTTEVMMINMSISIFKPTIFVMYGFSDDNLSTIFVFRPRKLTSFEPKEYALFLEGILLNYRNGIREKHSLLHELIVDVFQKRSMDPFVLSMQLRKSPNNVFESKFRINNTYSGTIISSEKNFSVQTAQFNQESFVFEGKLFGIIMSVTISLMYLYWKYFDTYLKPSDYASISPMSVIMGNAFDFGFAHSYLDIGRLSHRFYKMYLYGFYVLMWNYFLFQIHNLIITIKAYIPNTTENDRDGIYEMFSLSIIVSITSFSAFAGLHFFPTPMLIYLFSFWVPQIYFSALKNTKPIKTRFAIFITILRLIPMWYLHCYPMSVLDMYNPTAFVVCVIWCVIQLIIIFLQNQFGGAFFLPSSLQIKPFDYYSKKPPQGSECSICLTTIEANDLTVVTPCDHFFHEECLRRWTDEKLICPICRSPIPRLEQPEIL